MARTPDNPILCYANNLEVGMEVLYQGKAWLVMAKPKQHDDLVIVWGRKLFETRKFDKMYFNAGERVFYRR